MEGIDPPVAFRVISVTLLLVAVAGVGWVGAAPLHDGSALPRGVASASAPVRALPSVEVPPIAPAPPSVAPRSGCTTCYVATVPVNQKPWTPTYDPQNHLIYVPNDANLSVTVINGTTQAPVVQITTPTASDTPTYDPANGDLYVSCGDNPGSVAVIDGSTNSVIKVIPVGSYPATPVYVPTNGYLYVANQGVSENISIIDGSSNTIVGSIALPGSIDLNPYQDAPPTYDPANGDLYVATDTNSTSVINTTTNSIQLNITVGVLPMQPTLDPWNNELFVPNYDSANYTVINATTNTVVFNWPIGKWPLTGVFDPTDGQVWIPSSGTNQVNVISPSTNRPVYTLNTGVTPDTPLYDPDDTYVFVSAALGDTVIAFTSWSTPVAVNTITVPGSASILTPCFDPDNNDLYAPNTLFGSNFGHNVTVINGAAPLPLTVNASALPASGPAYLHVNFTGTANGGTSDYTLWDWSFGDGGSSSLQDPFHLYTAPGNYTVTVSVMDSLKNSSTSTPIVVQVARPFEVVASVNRTVGAAPLSVSFTATPEGADAGAKYLWSFGDLGQSTLQDPVHTYATEGIYNAWVNATNLTGYLVTSNALKITVSAAFGAFASAVPTSGGAPLQVAFTASAFGGSGTDTFSWAFGDGGTSALQQPVHTYQDIGHYNATVTAVDAVGDRATATVPIDVVLGGALLDVSATPTAGTAPLLVTFEAGAHGGAPPYNYTWRFGDGGVSYAPSPLWAYASAGVYTPWVWVNDSAGVSSSAPAPEVVVAAPSHLGAAAIAYPTSGPAPLRVAFTGTASGGDPPYGWMWRFGDGGNSTAKDPVHTYTSGGNYTAWLWVNDSAGSTVSTTTTLIDVNSSLRLPTEQATPASGSAPLAVDFSASAQGGLPPYSYAWYFGDGSTGTGATTMHTFSTPGAYVAWVVVTDAKGRTAQGPLLNISVGAAAPSALSKLVVPIALAVVAVVAILLLLIAPRRVRKGLEASRAGRQRELEEAKAEAQRADSGLRESLAYLDRQEAVRSAGESPEDPPPTKLP